MRDAIRALPQHRSEEVLKPDKLPVSLPQGIAVLDRGECSEIEDEGLDEYLDDLG